MTALQANLKHFYQRPEMWSWYLVLAVTIIPVVILPLTSAEDKSFSMYLIVSVFLGIIVASIQKEILTKPFSFCLPGYQKTLRRLFLLVGVLVNSMLGLIFIRYPGIDLPYSLLVICGAGFMGMAFYMLAIWLTLLGNNSFAYIGFAPLVVIGLEALGIEVGGMIEYVIITLPLYMIITSFLFCVFIWRYLGKVSLTRRHCDKVMLGLLSDATSKRVRLYMQNKALKKCSKSTVTFNNKLHESFLQRMKKHAFFTKRRYMLGHALMLQDKFLHLWSLGFSVTILLVIVFLGYIGTGELRAIDMLFLLPIAFSFNFNLLPYGSILLPGGRKEKYYASVGLAFAMTLLIVVVAVIVEALSILFAEILPTISLKGQIYSYQPMNIENLLACLLLMPVGFVFATLLPKNYISKAITMMALFIVWVFLWRLVVTTCVWMIPALILTSWAGFLMVLLYHCMRRPLVGQGR